MSFVDKDLLSIQEARILMENAIEARKNMAYFPQERLDQIAASMTKAVKKHLRELAKMSCEETGYGNEEDKYRKNTSICEYLEAELQGKRYVGILKEDKEKKTMDVGIPLGILASLLPAESPVSTALYQALIAVKSGNVIVFVPQERAKRTTAKVLEILAEAAREGGLPDGALSYMTTISEKGIQELLHHSGVSMILNTGVREWAVEAGKTGKPYIYGGTGNGPVFIERTADIHQAVKDIVASRYFDYGIMPGAEQYVVADSCVAHEVRKEFQACGGYFMSLEEEEKLSRLLCLDKGSQDPELVGKSVKELARRAGFTIPDTAKVLISEQKYISDKNPYARELLCPVLVYYIENDWIHACEKCLELLAENRNGHTLVIHSKDEEVIRQFALKKPVGRILVNTPAVFGSMGVTTNLFPAMTLGSVTAGMGITADNVSPSNLTYIRKVGYGVRNVSEPECKVKETVQKAEETVRNAEMDHRSQHDESDLTDVFRKLMEWMSEEQE